MANHPSSSHSKFFSNPFASKPLSSKFSFTYIRPEELDIHHISGGLLLPSTDSIVSDCPFSSVAARAYVDVMSQKGLMFDERILDVIQVGSFWMGSSQYESVHSLRILSSMGGRMSLRTELVDSQHNRVVTLPHGSRTAYKHPTHNLCREDIAKMVDGLLTGEYKQPADGSLAQTVCSNIAGLFSGATSPQADPQITAAVDQNITALRVKHKKTPLEAFRWCVKNWRNLKDSPIWTHVCNILAIGIATGLAPEKWGTLEINSVKIFQLTQQHQYTDALSIIDGIMNATEYFVEAAVASWEVGNFLPFFFEKYVSSVMDDLYDEVSDLVPQALSGAYHRAGKNWSELIWKIEQCANAFREARNVAPPRSLQRKILADRVTLLESWRFQLLSCIKAGDVVEQPFANITVGQPRCGKTQVTKDLIKIHSVVYGIEFAEEMVANMVPGDAYHSQVQNHTIYLVYDDIAANRPQYDKAMGIVGIIQTVNNMRFVAIKAEAELKGRVMPELGAVMGTTNVEHMNASVFALTLAALRQRYLLTRMRTLPQYSNEEGGINPHLIKLHPPDKISYGGMTYNDVSRFDICISHGGPHRVARATDPDSGQQILLENLTVEQYYKWMEKLMAQHIESQREHVARIKGTNFTVCKKCKLITCTCPKTEEPQGGGDDDPIPLNFNLEPIEEEEDESDSEPEPNTAFERGPSAVGYLRTGYFAAPYEPDHSPPKKARFDPDPDDPDEDVGHKFYSNCHEELTYGYHHSEFQMGTPPYASDERQQGFFADAIYHGASHAVSSYVASRPHEPGLLTFARNSCDPAWWSFTSHDFTKELLEFTETTPYIQWWYWVPDSIWNSEFCRRLSYHFKDDQLRHDIRTTAILYFRFKWLTVALFVIGLPLSNFDVFNTMSLSIALFILLVYLRLTYLLRRYQESAYEILTTRRNLMGHFRDAQLSKMTEAFRFMLKAVGGLAAGFAAYKGLSFVYNEFISDEPRDPNADVPVCVAFDQAHSRTDFGSITEFRSVPPVVNMNPPDVKVVCSGPNSQYEDPPDELGAPSMCTSQPSGITCALCPGAKLRKRPKCQTPSDEAVMTEPLIISPSYGERKQGFMSVTSSAVAERDNEVDAWRKTIVQKRATYKPPNGMSSKQFVDKALKGLVSVFRLNEADEWFFHCNAYFYDTGLCIMGVGDKAHYTQQWLLVSNSTTHARRELTVSESHFTNLKCGKLCIGRLGFSSFAPKRTFFNSNPGELRALYYMRLENGELRNPMPVTGVLDPIPEAPNRIKWKFPVETQVGMCGGIYISPESRCIMGIHYAGWVEDFHYGFSSCPTVDEFIRVDTVFVSQCGVLLPNALDPDDFHVVVNGSQQFTPTPKLGKGNLADQADWLADNKEGYPKAPSIPTTTVFPNDVYMSDQISNITGLADDESGQGSSPFPPVPIQFLRHFGVPEEELNLSTDETWQGAIYVGRRETAAFYKSKVVSTTIADDVRSHFPNDLDFGPPRFGKWMWGRGSAHAIRSTPGVPREHLEWAVRDWLSVYKNNRLPSRLRKYLRPLTWDEVLNGIDGVRFLDAINFGTSAGAGFPGSKRAYIETYLDLFTGHERKIFLTEVWDQVAIVLEKFDKGERVPFLFIGTPKDEPTLTTKEKVRLFMVGEIAAVLISRRTYTPVLRVMQMLPGWSECCVGLNATSPHWDDLWERFATFPHHFDGDYSKYDLSKNSDLSAASYWLCIQIASLGDYTADDLYQMSCVANEFLLPLCAYKQEVWLLAGSTPSGIPVTVNINGLDNSLLNRCAYKHCYPDAIIGEFRSYVKHGNYGDDFINAVSPERTNFNFMSMKEYLGFFGVKITPGIKEAEGSPFVESLDALVFLQRFSTRLPELPYRIGKLKEASILKSLISVMQSGSDWDRDFATAQNVDGALREWVYHGEEIYEARRLWLDEVLTKHNIRHLSALIDTPYIDLLTHLQSDWLPDHPAFGQG